MRIRVGHVMRVATLLGLTLTAVAISAQDQNIMNDAAVTGSNGVSEDNNNKIDFKNAEALPLPAAPDSVVKQAEKDLIESLMNRNRASIPSPVGHEVGSEGDGMTSPVELGKPSVTPDRNDVKRP